ARALLVAELVEGLVREREVEGRSLEGRVVPAGAGWRRDDRAGQLGRAEVDDADDLLPVDRVIERLLDLEVEEFAVLLLLRVRVDDEVGLVEPLDVLDDESRAAQRLHRRRRNA